MLSLDFRPLRPYFCGLLLSLLMTGSSIPSWAQQPQEKELRFITIDVAPWAYYDEQSQEFEGAFVEAVKELMRRTGYDISISLTPFARVDREMESGGHDCTILVPRSEEIVVSGEFFSYHDIGLVPHKNITLNEYDDLRSLNISLLRGSAITERFDTDPELNKEYDTDYLIALRKLARQRVDAVAGALPTILYLAKKNNLDQHLGQAFKLTEIPLVFQCSRKSLYLDAMPAINRALEAMRADGTIDKIKADYYF